MNLKRVWVTNDNCTLHQDIQGVCGGERFQLNGDLHVMEAELVRPALMVLYSVHLSGRGCIVSCITEY